MPDGPRPMRKSLVLGAILFSWVALGLSGQSARADRITLRGGGVVKGKLLNDPKQPGQLLLLGEVGKTPMILKKDQVIQIVAEKSDLDDYIGLREKERPSADAEYRLGIWCEEHHLKDLALVHFEATLKRDSTFDLAHRKLGHVLMDGRWLNADEVKEAQGLVRVKGHWMTPEEKERRDMLAATAAEGSTWVKKLRLLREGYLAGPIERAREAERRLLAIDDPVAIGPVLKVLGEDPSPVIRSMASKILGAIPGTAATNALVGRFLQEEDESVRQITMNELARRDSAEVVPLLTRSLRSKYHLIVNRSGWGLGNLNVVSTVPKLVPALITIEYEIVNVETSTPAGGMNFNAVTPTPGVGGYQGGSLPILTPPAVAPGAVAYGATSVPFANGGPGGTSFSVGSGGSREPSPRLVPIEYRNDEVHAALVKMTGRDFGYDIASWKQWIATSFKVDAPPTRRVPQP